MRLRVGRSWTHLGVEQAAMEAQMLKFLEAADPITVSVRGALTNIGAPVAPGFNTCSTSQVDFFQFLRRQAATGRYPVENGMDAVNTVGHGVGVALALGYKLVGLPDELNNGHPYRDHTVWPGVSKKLPM